MLLALKLGLCLPGNITPQGLQTQMPTGTTHKRTQGNEGSQPESAVTRKYKPHPKGRAHCWLQPSVIMQEWKTGVVKSADFSRKEKQVQNFI